MSPFQAEVERAMSRFKMTSTMIMEGEQKAGKLYLEAHAITAAGLCGAMVSHALQGTSDPKNPNLDELETNIELMRMMFDVAKTRIMALFGGEKTRP